MVYVKHLNAVTQNELQAVGYRSQDLALLQQNQIPIAGAFVVLSNALDETIRLNNLKYKIDYVMSHAQAQVQSSLQNVYSSARKALLEAKLPPGFEVELREFYESITTPLAIGELVAERPSVRLIMSTNRLEDPESNDDIVQNVNSFEELLVAIRETWALSWHPTPLGGRLRERFPESRLKVALVVQTMDDAVTSTHAYSCLPQDHGKIYLQVYYGMPDLRERVTKDYYAISKETMRVVATQIKQQLNALQRSDTKELTLTQVPQTPGDKMADRDLEEIARLTKKAERLLQHPVKAFFVSTRDMHELLWVNRLGFEIIIGEERPESPQAAASERTGPAPEAAEPTAETPDWTKAEDILETVEAAAPSQDASPTPIDTPPAATEQETAQGGQQPDDFIVETPKPGIVSAKLLLASLRIVHQVVERKHRSEFGDAEPIGNVAEAIARLNAANVFSRPADGALLMQAEQAANSGSSITEDEYAKAVEEVAYLLNYA